MRHTVFDPSHFILAKSIQIQSRQEVHVLSMGDILMKRLENVQCRTVSTILTRSPSEKGSIQREIS